MLATAIVLAAASTGQEADEWEVESLIAEGPSFVILAGETKSFRITMTTIDAPDHRAEFVLTLRFHPEATAEPAIISLDLIDDPLTGWNIPGLPDVTVDGTTERVVLSRSERDCFEQECTDSFVLTVARGDMPPQGRVRVEWDAFERLKGFDSDEPDDLRVVIAIDEL